jgi:pimeloyl-ACP methyl ester carboxylesterase
MRRHPILIGLAFALGLAAAPAVAQTAQFVPFRGTVKGALYKPESGPAPHVGIVVMHRTANYLTHPACTELSKRGFMLLCMTTRYENNESMVDYEKLPLDVKAGVEFLRKQPGITKVLLFGHSGGGPLMSLYQAVAENGPAYCKGPNKLTECGDDLAGLPPADGIIFADPNPGNSVNTLRRINPAAANEHNPPDAPPVADVDMFDPKNGFNPNGASHYSEEFENRYYKAQADRMNRLIAMAQDKLARIKAKDYGYSDDDIVVIPWSGNPGSGAGGSESGIFVTQPDTPYFNSTARPQKLLLNDGTVATQVVQSAIMPNT